MDSDLDPSGTTSDRRRTVDVARDAASGAATAARVLELEAQLAAERAENARRLREMDHLVQRTRSALHEVQAQFRRVASERDEIREQLQLREVELHELELRLAETRARAERALTEREGPTAEVVAAAIGRAQRAERELTELRVELADVRRRDAGGAAVRSGPAAPESGSTYVPVGDVFRGPSEASSADDESDTWISVVPETRSESRSSHPTAAETEPERVARPRAAPPAPRRERRALPSIHGLSIEGEVASDDDGRVLVARDDASGRGVTVRILPPGATAPSPESVARLTAVRHHNVAAVLRCGSAPDGPYVVSERPAGERVDAWVRRARGVSARIALAVALQVARGLSAAAAEGVHHGDLSPSAVWMDAGGVVRTVGVGIPELLPGLPRRSPAAYVAPEVEEGAAPSVAADVYALGACIRFLLGGTRAVENPGRLVEAPAADTRRLAELAEELCAHDPAGRPASWDDVVLRLESCLGRAPDADVGAPADVVAYVSQRPYVIALALAAAGLVAWGVTALLPGAEAATRAAFNAAVVRAAELEAQGNVEGARRLYLEFTENTGDPDIELDAARRLDLLRDRD